MNKVFFKFIALGFFFFSLETFALKYSNFSCRNGRLVWNRMSDPFARGTIKFGVDIYPTERFKFNRITQLLYITDNEFYILMYDMTQQIQKAQFPYTPELWNTIAL